MVIWDFDKYGDSKAMITENADEISYRELKEKCNAIAKICGRRCLVFVLCENSAGSVIGYTAFLNNHIVPVLLNAKLDRELLSNLVRIYHPIFLWAPIHREEEMSDLYGTKSVYESDDYVLLRTLYDCHEAYDLNEDLCLMLTTSGSTGSPKFVRQSYVNVVDNAKSIVNYLKITSTERPITTLPMNYTYGLSIINSHLMVGATLLLTDKTVVSREFWRFFKDKGATSFGGVPFTYEMLYKMRFAKMELPTLRYMTQAGGKITPELHQKFAEYAAATGKEFIVMYGQSEATARMGYLPSDKALEKCGSMGIAIPGGQFRLIDTNGCAISESGVTGELVYEGTNVTMGYAECGEDLCKGDERGGILETGDMAQFDEDGYYYIVGRKKRFLKIFGNRVNLDEIDRLLKGKFDNIDVASTGIDDHMYIFITDRSISEDIKAFIVEKTQLNHSAFKIIVIDQIPKNEFGKIQYKKLEGYYL